MTVMLWCLVLAAFIPSAIAMATGIYRARQFGTIDNKNPRVQYARLEGTGERLVAAQANSWEMLQVFAVFVFIAQVTGADQYQAGIASMAFIVTRIFYVVFYAQ